MPKYDDSRLPKTLTDLRESFPQTRPEPREETVVTITREKTTGSKTVQLGDHTCTCTPVFRKKISIFVGNTIYIYMYFDVFENYSQGNYMHVCFFLHDQLFARLDPDTFKRRSASWGSSEKVGC